MKLYPAYNMQKASSRAARVEPINVITLRSSCTLFRVYACYKKNLTLLKCTALFTPGLLLVFLTSEITQE